jgi:membrane protease YdiL (CAAX protease family)
MPRARVLALYVLLVYLAGWGLQLAALRVTPDLEAPAAMPYLLADMAVPGLIALVFAVFHRPSRQVLAWKPRWRMLPLMLPAVGVPALTAFAVLAILAALGLAHSGWFAFSPEGVAISGGPWMLGRGLQAWPLFAANVAVTGFAYAALSAIPAVGEELGWRGYLLAPLVERLGTGRGIALLGLIWSFWHLPALLSGYNYPETPQLGAFVLFPLELIGVSFFLAWLTVRSGSFWPAALAHGAGNSIQEGVTANLQMGARLPEDLTTMAVSVAIGLACWALLTDWRNRTRRGMVST